MVNVGVSIRVPGWPGTRQGLDDVLKSSGNFAVALSLAVMEKMSAQACNDCGCVQTSAQTFEVAEFHSFRLMLPQCRLSAPNGCKAALQVATAQWAERNGCSYVFLIWECDRLGQ